MARALGAGRRAAPKGCGRTSRSAVSAAALTLLCVSTNTSAIVTGYTSEMGAMRTGSPLRIATAPDAFASRGVDPRASWRPRSTDRQRRYGESRIIMSSMPHADLAIRLDTPLLAPAHHRRPTTLAALKCIGGMLISDVFKAAVVAFVLAFAMSLISRAELDFPGLVAAPFRKVASGAAFCFRWARGHMLRTADKVKTGGAAIVGSSGPPVPMAFDGEGGWGVCTLLRKEPVGRSSYVKYDFALPDKDNVLPLSLGQQIVLCCLDDDNNVVQGDFFPYSSRKERGKFSLLCPGGSDMEKNRALIGLERANFARALRTDICEGDELAVRPGQNRLEYRGQYLPVNEMIFFASGMGIVPVVEEIKAVLPNGSSSVKLASVIWFDENVKNFDIADKQLEAEYKKYPSKLAVTCIDDDLTKDNPDVEEAVPNFAPGIMAVVSGPRSFSQKAVQYLVDRGYPKDCICVLP